jgi:ubiquinone/menaquinone biosynthesis C-methylase UbiE
MLASVKSYLANQARKPTGWFGRVVAPIVFNRENKPMEQFGLKLLDPQKDDRILEIGPGNGRLISEIMPTIEEGKVYGIDISEQMVELTSKRNKKWIDKGLLETRKASISDIPYPNNHFDKVFTCNTIYFWPDPVKDLNEVFRVLKPNGVFLCALRTKRQMESINSVVRDNKDVFQNLYQDKDVKQLFKKARFVDINHHKKHIIQKSCMLFQEENNTYRSMV